MSDSAPVTPAAPAPPATTEPSTVSATIAAVEKRDFGAFSDAAAAERKGAPLARVEVKADPAKETPETAPAANTPPAQVSKRQQQINDYERRIAEQDQRIRSLEAGINRPTAPAEPPAPREPEWKRFASMPESPKLADFDSVEEHAAAMSYFIATTLRSEERQTVQKQSHQEQRERFLTERSEKFGSALHKAQEADPEFISKIPPALVHAQPLSGMSPEARKSATFANSAAEAAFRSDAPDVLLKYLHAHQDETVAIARRHPSEWLPALIRLDGRLSAASTPDAPAVPSAPAPSPISAAPQPVPALTRAGATTDPEAAALARRDFPAWKAHRQAKRLAAMRESA